MSEYIEREKIKKILESKAEMSIGTPKEVFYNASRMLDFIPPADVVEVVRCKDCEYYNPNYKKFESDIPYNRCEHPAQQFDVECYDMWLETDPNDFCSYGKRKDGAD